MDTCLDLLGLLPQALGVSGFRVWGLGLGVRFRVCGLGFGVWGLRFWGLGFRV